MITAATEDQGRVPAEQTLGEIILSVLAALFPDIHYSFVYSCSVENILKVVVLLISEI